MQGQLSTMRFIRKGEDISTVVDISQNIDGLPIIPTQCMEKAPVNSTCSSSLDCMLSFKGSGSSGSGGGCGGGTGGWVAQTTYYYTDWFMSRGNGILEYQNTQYDGSSTEWVWVERTGFGGTNGSYDKDSYRYGSDNGGYFNEPPVSTDENKRIVYDIFFKENPCKDEILDKLREGDTRFSFSPDLIGLSVTLPQAIIALFDASPKFKLKIKVGDLNGLNAQTRPHTVDGVTNISITLDKHYLQNATDLAIARTMIHESVHAYLLWLYASKNNITDAKQTHIINLLDFYWVYKGFKRNENHHNVMAWGFVDAIAQSLAAYDNHRLPQEYYNALAWSGDMLQTSYLGDFSQNQKDLIIKANINEGQATNKATSEAKGKTCS